MSSIHNDFNNKEYNAQMSRAQKHENWKPEVGTAWLVLSHGTWIGSAIACAAISTAIIVFGSDKWKALGIGWCVMGIILLIWTLYAIFQTWKASKAFERPIFSSFGFLLLMLTTLFTAGAIVWTLVDVATS